jgi:hypothetical protein
MIGGLLPWVKRVMPLVGSLMVFALVWPLTIAGVNAFEGAGRLVLRQLLAGLVAAMLVGSAVGTAAWAIENRLTDQNRSKSKSGKDHVRRTRRRKRR